jgi:3',5'-cyclic-AMP phosphodiesterase
LAQAMKGGAPKAPTSEDFPSIQISDGHIGFNKGANPNVTGTLTKAIGRVNVAPAWMKAPDFMIHTGDMFPASMTSSTMANSTSSVSAKVPRPMAGISLMLTKISQRAAGRSQ